MEVPVCSINSTGIIHLITLSYGILFKILDNQTLALIAHWVKNWLVKFNALDAQSSPVFPR